MWSNKKIYGCITAVTHARFARLSFVSTNVTQVHTIVIANDSHLISPNANLIIAAAVPNGSTVAYGSGFKPNENFIIAVLLSNSNTQILGGGSANNSGAFNLESILQSR